ncbi:hypothetical protein C8R44DRAFT_148858 [Mycena epipterygia]|nr:hypothetical protein C8R44DRAFT_148858 [Mycena epipterygia]
MRFFWWGKAKQQGTRNDHTRRGYIYILLMGLPATLIRFAEVGARRVRVRISTTTNIVPGLSGDSATLLLLPRHRASTRADYFIATRRDRDWVDNLNWQLSLADSFNLHSIASSSKSASARNHTRVISDSFSFLRKRESLHYRLCIIFLDEPSDHDPAGPFVCARVPLYGRPSATRRVCEQRQSRQAWLAGRPLASARAPVHS